MISSKNTVTIDENFVNDRSHKSTPQIYKELCMALNCSINNSVIHSLKNMDFCLNLEHIHEEDLPALSILLSQCRLNSIFLQGTDPDKNESMTQPSKSKSLLLKKSYNSINGTSSEIKSKKPKQEKSIYLKPEMMETLLRAISINLEEVHAISQIRLQYLKFPDSTLFALSEGLIKSTSLKELRITHCHLRNERFSIILSFLSFSFIDIESITNALCLNSSLIVVDFSHNDLTKNIGAVVGKILSSHCEKRNEVVWMYSLRGEYPAEDLSLKGICEINLSYNQVDDTAIRDLCHFLKYDTWSRSINLRGNHIQEEGIREITDVILGNESIISLDLRNNPGFTHTYSRVVLEKLIKNIQLLKSQKQEVNNHENNMGNNEDFERYLHDNTSDKSPISANFAEGSSTKNPLKSQTFSNKKPTLNNPQRTVSNNVEAERDGQREDNNNNIIKSLYDEKDENPSFANKCKNCYELEKRLLKSEQKNVNLMFENKKLKDALNNNMGNNQQNMMHSWSAINMNNPEENPNLNVMSMQNPANNESEELLNRIENLMVELTRMMDNLENANHTNVTNNNLTYQLTNSTSNFNNNTYHLMNSANTINFNSILNNQSNNLSNIVPNINNNLVNRVNLNSPIASGNNANQNVSVGHFGGGVQSAQKENTALNKSAGFH